MRRLPTVRAQLALVAALALALLLGTLSLGHAFGAAKAGPATAAAAAKKCARGKVAVKRPGRSAVCAKRCPSGRKHKVSKRGKVTCARKRKAPAAAPTAPAAAPAPTAPAPAPTTPAPEQPPVQSGPANGAFSGTTEQSRPVTFTVSGGQVTNFEAGVNTWCSTQGNQRTNFDAIANIPPMAIGPDGSFSYEGDETNGNVKISGQVTGGSATGTVGMMRGDTNYSDGQMKYGSCMASDVKWNAAAG